MYALTGKRQGALRVIEQLQQESKRTYVDSWQIAYVYVALGEKDQAFKWLDKAYEESSPGLTVLKIAPFYDPLRPDPRFQDLLRRVGLS